jgi:hypothetical protein
MADDSSNLANLRNVARQLVAAQQHPTPESIREAIDQCRGIAAFAVDDGTAEQLAREIESQLDVTMTLGSVVQEEFAEWYDAAKASIDPYYWDRYRRLLDQKGFPPDVLAKLDQVTSRITGLLENPQKDGDWDRRGMVVGNVQSGKTANYTGLVCKAADAGYKLIVIIAGIHNNLRNQTQQRIDEGFVGRDSASLARNRENKIIGVGKFDTRRFPLTVTTSLRDFNKATAEVVGVELRALNVPAVLVIKKNQSTLRNHIDWLKEHNARGGSALVDAPMLLIDDEADNASINTSRNPREATKINSLIRELLNLFRRKCYVGYTATPFANIFIDPDTDTEMLRADLFPRDFIVSLDPPSNYFGALRIFGPEREVDVLRDIIDNEPLLPIKHRKDLVIQDLPESLRTAIRTFILVRAIRLLRGQTRAHNSMLVNASRFTDVQKRIRDLIHAEVEQIVTHVRIQGALPPEEALRDNEIARLREIFDEEFADCGFGWDEIQEKLLEASAPIRVEEVNSRSTGSLVYSDHEEHGLNVIAVGGFSLSRGLTLEGLTVSYFLRNSVMYDTLLQMGRWFGYRPDYEDLCRIWMPPEAIGWYEHITESIEELREELRRMERAGLTPKDFGLKVRSHPDTLIVTARNKLGSSKELRVRIGLANRFIETARLHRMKRHLQHNFDLLEATVGKLIESKGPPTHWPGSAAYFWSDVPAGTVIDFVTEFRNHPTSVNTDPAPVAAFIRAGSDLELGHWDVALVTLERGGTEPVDVAGLPVIRETRSAGRQMGDDWFMVTNKQRVSSRGVERIGVPEDDAQEAEDAYRSAHPPKGEKPPNYPDRIYRMVRPRPLLILHLLHVNQPDEIDPAPAGFPLEKVVAWSISFPEAPETAARHPTVEYVVNTVWWRENFGDESEDEELEDVDEAA